MKRFLYLAGALTLVLSSCMTTPKEPLRPYTITVTSEDEAAGIHISATYFTSKELFGGEGIGGFNVTFKNSTSRIARVIWEESSINYNGNSFPVFIDGQKYAEASRPMPPTIITVGATVSKSVYSAAQPDYVSGQYGGWRMRPIHAASVQIVLCVEYEETKTYFTVKAQ